MEVVLLSDAKLTGCGKKISVKDIRREQNLRKEKAGKSLTVKEHQGFRAINFRQPSIARLAAAIKLSVVFERNFLQYAMPTPSGGGAGCKGRIFNRGLPRPLSGCAITATPLPDSIAAKRLVMLSCSSTICGERFRGANKLAIQA
jgi:hypothetical protein